MPILAAEGGTHMEKDTMNRREAITRTLCAGSMLCLSGTVLGAPLYQDETLHKFLGPSELTHQELFQFAFSRNYIPIMKVLEEKIGLDSLQEAAWEAAVRRVEAQAARLPKRNLPTLAAHYKNPRVQNWFTMQVVEETDNVFEMKITECLWAKTFREADAAAIGFRCICNADFAIAEAFNPKIELSRDKTLMQGHSHCNHRYVMEV
jgi:hypothetical protein